MSDFSDILVKVRANLQMEGHRYTKAASTSAGASDGTTVVSTSLTQLDDAWNAMDCVMLDGAEAGDKRIVEDFTASSDTLSFTNNAWNSQIASGVNFELTERGLWSSIDLKNFIEQAGDWFLRKAVDLSVNYTIRETIVATSGEVDLPDKVMKFIHPKVTVGGTVAGIISPKRARQLDDDPYVTTSNRPFGYFVGRGAATDNVGSFKFVPATNASCIFNYVPVAEFASDNSWKVPEEAWTPIQFIATGLAYNANKRPELGNIWIQKGFGFLPDETEMENEPAG